jgi:hypothetical protein
MPKSFKPEVIADNSGEWCANGQCFATEDEARKAVTDLSFRWIAVRETRVVPSDDEVTYKWDPEQGAIPLK